MTTDMTYRRSSVAGASTFGLMIALFDTLVRDFQRAAAALRKNDIETRCRELNHAALVVGQLESWVDLEKGGQSAESLTRFYRNLRAKMIEASATKSGKVLEEQIEAILHVRSAWQKLDSTPQEEPDQSTGVPAERMNAAYSPTSDAMSDRVPFSLSA
jgi:flagellar protein FliS